MKKLFPALAFLCCCVPALSTELGAADDCSGAADACKAPPKTLSPFMAEVKKAEEAPQIKHAPPAVSPSPAAAVAGAAQAEKKDAFSKPGWLLAVFLLLAGLYYFLKEEKKRGRKS